MGETTKYKNVNADSLNEKASSAKDFLKSKNMSAVSSSFSSFQFQGKVNIENALNKIQSGGVEGSIKNLEDKLDNLISVAGYISTCKSCAAKIAALRAADSSYEEVYGDFDPITCSRPYLGRFLKESVDREIKSQKSKLEEAEAKADAALS